MFDKLLTSLFYILNFSGAQHDTSYSHCLVGFAVVCRQRVQNEELSKHGLLDIHGE
jgi:hypothetical protein